MYERWLVLTRCQSRGCVRIQYLRSNFGNVCTRSGKKRFMLLYIASLKWAWGSDKYGSSKRLQKRAKNLGKRKSSWWLSLEAAGTLKWSAFLRICWFVRELFLMRYLRRNEGEEELLSILKMKSVNRIISRCWKQLILKDSRVLLRRL